MYDVHTVADAILKIAKANGKVFTPMQLTKLLYIAHGWSLGLRQTILFKNRIEAWKYGPIIPDLYQSTKSFGRAPIPLELIGDPGEINVTPKDRLFLEDVFSKYGHLDGIQLSYLTHLTGTPWHKVFKQAAECINIPDSLIEEYYRELKSLHAQPCLQSVREIK